MLPNRSTFCEYCKDCSHSWSLTPNAKGHWFCGKGRIINKRGVTFEVREENCSYKYITLSGLIEKALRESNESVQP